MPNDWYFGRSGRSQGPVSWEELRDRAADGSLSPGDLVWRTGWVDWQPAEEVEGLLGSSKPTAAVDTATAPPPPPPPLPASDAEEGPPKTADSRLPLSLLVGLGGAGAAAAMLVTGIVLFVLLRSGSGTGQRSFSILLAPGQIEKRSMVFRAGRQAEVRVATQGQGGMANVDMEIRQGHHVHAADAGPGGDCLVRFLPNRTERYEIWIINHGPAPARCQVRIE